MSPLARNIIETLSRHGFEAYLVGGCVRDLLLGISPKDFDVATSARPESILALFPDAQMVGAHFGVALISRNGESVEVATFRSDGHYLDGRHPETVQYETSPARDAMRRDFTINALFLNVQNDEVLDFFGGRDDLKAGVIRAIGNAEERFREDHLRMLRAVRFACRFGYTIDGVTMAAIQKLSSNILAISAERIRDEMNRILTEGGARRGLELLDESGLLGVLLPEVKAMQGVEQPPQFHPEGDVWIHTLMLLEGMQQPTVSLAWGVLLHDVAKPPTFTNTDRIRFNGHAELGAKMTREILGRFKMPAAEVEKIESLVLNHMRFKDAPNMKQSNLKRFLRIDGFEELLELHRLDCTSSNRRFGNYEFAKQKLAELGPEQLRPQRLVTGNDLNELGYQPGPLFRQILTALEDGQLDGTVTTREEALAFIDQRWPATASQAVSEDPSKSDKLHHGQKE